MEFIFLWLTLVLLGLVALIFSWCCLKEIKDIDRAISLNNKDKDSIEFLNRFCKRITIFFWLLLFVTVCYSISELLELVASKISNYK